MGWSEAPKGHERLHELASAAGYLSVLIVPGLLVVAVWIDKAFLVVGFVFLVFPLARLVLGGCSSQPAPAWSERTATLLDRLPHVCAAVLLFAVLAVIVHIDKGGATLTESAGWALSLWLSLVFATCVAHELHHRRSRRERIVSHLLAGLAGYPVLGYEHHRNHRLAGSTDAAEWPKASESVWRFAGRRSHQIGGETLGARGIAWFGEAHDSTVQGLRMALAATLGTLALFAVMGGWAGAMTYLSVIGLVAFSMQLVTYMQHWGLGDDVRADAQTRAWGWEHDCRLQAWVTLNLSLHHAHHLEPQRPYYRTPLAAGSPRLPAGYVLLMFAACVPQLWKHVMTPVLDCWRAAPAALPSAGRGLVCTNFYRRT